MNDEFHISTNSQSSGENCARGHIGRMLFNMLGKHTIVYAFYVYV